jgi:hypothetical protein
MRKTSYNISLSLILIILQSCASADISQMDNRLKNSEISMGSLLDLVRSSYLKGCTDNSAISFKGCVKKAKQHQNEIHEILNK